MSFAPPGESASDLWLERSFFNGNFIGGVAYGVHLMLFSTIVYVMAHKKSDKKRFFLSYSFLLFALGTTSVALAQKYGEMMWIDDRNYPGGPSAWFKQQFSDPVNSASNATFVIATLFADGLFLYRLWIIWNHNYYVVLLPALMFLSLVGLSVMTIFQTSKPGKDATSKTTLSSAVPYGVISITLNVVLTLMIAYRLLSMRKTVKQVLGDEQARPYTSITAMVVESSTLYTATALVFIISYVCNSNFENIMFTVVTQVVCIAPELVILRVAHGLAWTGATTRHQAEGNMSHMSFKPGTLPSVSSPAVIMEMDAADCTSESIASIRPHHSSVITGDADVEIV